MLSGTYYSQNYASIIRPTLTRSQTATRALSNARNEGVLASEIQGLLRRNY